MFLPPALLGFNSRAHSREARVHRASWFGFQRPVPETVNPNTSSELLRDLSVHGGWSTFSPLFIMCFSGMMVLLV